MKPQLAATAPNQVWSWAATIDRPMIDRLFDLVLVEQRENVQLEGGSVLGRTMIA